ncbi:MAG TPA: FkbM family methyltransferase [Ktedonobacteraceae bacterium]|nr:FkbM family methyltransferase [Ktedonobacteraceae bacterium]
MKTDLMLNRNWPSITVNCVRVMQRYRNWPEILASIAKKQYPMHLILKDGTQFELAGGWKWRGQVEKIFFENDYLPAPLHIKPNDVVVDVGAHVGVFAIFAASMTYNKVYAFEPFPSNYEILAKTVAINGLKQIIPQQAAVSDKVGTAVLQLSPISSTRHFLSDSKILQTLEDYQTRSESFPFAKVMPGELKDTLEVPTVTLPEIMDKNHIEQIGFLKLNCEGAEGLILNATPIKYLKKIRQIYLHFHKHLSPTDPNEMRKRLEESGLTTILEWDGESPLGHIYGWRDCD